MSAGRAGLVGLLTALGLWVPALASPFQASTDKQLFECLVRPPGLPAFPDGAIEREKGALVRTNIVFTAPDAEPKVEVFYNSGDPGFEEAVKAHVRAYRLPCMSPGAGPVAAAQEFKFAPGDGKRVHANPARLTADDAKCLSYGRGLPVMPVSGPVWARDIAKSGTVLAEIKFEGVGLPPRVKILFNGGNPKLGHSVLEHVEAEYRLSCAPALGFPWTGAQAFVFRRSGDEQYSFQNVGLRDFVGALKNIERTGAVFDFSTMSCPFEVELSHFQPHADNGVDQVGSADPNRREFLHWLRKATLNLSGEAANQLVGGRLKISVPCGKLDLS